ncbi:MAG: hypothetical protein KGO82_10845 [Bacteroidota bacterium]|nr:hypothetical protein [Bacteroidota bacterium]
MKIKLVETGGIVPLNKEAEAETEWTKEECEHLLKLIASNTAGSAARDAISHSLIVNRKETPIDLSKLPAKYRTLFNQLLKDMHYMPR